MTAIMTILPRDANSGVPGLSDAMGWGLMAFSFLFELSRIRDWMTRPGNSLGHYALAFIKRIPQD
jgi:hypothetical protein